MNMALGAARRLRDGRDYSLMFGQSRYRLPVAHRRWFVVLLNGGFIAALRKHHPVDISK
jgi:hypothetical protein